jgi:PKD repeat protein
MRGIVEGDTGGLTVTNSKITLDIGTSDLAVTFLNGTGRIADSDLSAHLGVDVTGSNVTVERISLFSSVRGIRVNPSGINGSMLHLSSSILLPLGGSPALRVEGTFGSQPVSADVHHVTIAGGSSDTGASVASTASDASLVLDSSIIRLGVPITRDQQGSTADNVSADYSDISTGSTNSGSGSITMGAHNVDVDPQFVSATDYQLKPTSPVIDIGNPAIDPMESPTDFAFFPRLVAGHGGCTPVSDMGAYEFQHHEPTAAATVTPTTATAGTAVTFDASGSCDSTPGEPLSYSWTFDDGGTGTGVTVAHTFASAGPHTGTVTVSDTGATTSKATATVQVNAAPVTNPPPPDTPDFLGATLKGSRTLTVDEKGRFSWRFACPTGSPATCHEVVKLTADKRTVASARFNVLAGKTKTVHSKLSKRARKTLRRKKKLTARATITSTGDPGDVKVGQATVKLKL